MQNSAQFEMLLSSEVHPHPTSDTSVCLEQVAKSFEKHLPVFTVVEISCVLGVLRESGVAVLVSLRGVPTYNFVHMGL